MFGGFDQGSVPDNHNGQDAFTFQIHFSEEPTLTAPAVRDNVLTVTNGDVTSAVQTTAGENIRWTITLEPDGDDDVTVQLPPTTSCSADGAVCTDSGKMLSNPSSITVVGPEATPPPTPVPNNPASGRPVITGTAQVGETLTVDTSTITDDDGMTNAAFTYQWGRDGLGITDATGTTYTITEADQDSRILVVVAFTDDAGHSETLSSPATAAVVGTPDPNNQATGQPTIIGTPRVDQALTARTSAIADEDGLSDVTYAYQWIANDSDIDGAQGSTYIVKQAQLGQSLQVRVSFTDDAGNAESLTSAATAPVAAAPNRPATGSPAINGTPQVGQTLAADTSGIMDRDGTTNASYSYQWTADTEDIAGATGPTLTLTASHQGKTIQVTVSFTDDRDNTESLTSAATSAVTSPPDNEPPGKPTGLTAALNADGSITLSWTAPTGTVDGYQILRRLPRQGQSALNIYVADTDSTNTTYTDTATGLDTRYVYRVKARNGDLIGERSNYARVDK